MYGHLLGIIKLFYLILYMKTWIYYMKTKDEMFSKFIEFNALVEN